MCVISSAIIGYANSSAFIKTFTLIETANRTEIGHTSKCSRNSGMTRFTWPNRLDFDGSWFVGNCERDTVDFNDNKNPKNESAISGEESMD